jgi:hypothetical protein
MGGEGKGKEGGEGRESLLRDRHFCFMSEAFWGVNHEQRVEDLRYCQHVTDLGFSKVESLLLKN